MSTRGYLRELKLTGPTFYSGLTIPPLILTRRTIHILGLFFFFLQAEGEDNLKKMQLMELAILNGTYRDTNIKARKRRSRAVHTRTQPAFC